MLYLSMNWLKRCTETYDALPSVFSGSILIVLPNKYTAFSVILQNGIKKSIKIWASNSTFKVHNAFILVSVQWYKKNELCSISVYQFYIYDQCIWNAFEWLFHTNICIPYKSTTLPKYQADFLHYNQSKYVSR